MDNHSNHNNNVHCDQVPLVVSGFPTKAALKHFETPGPSDIQQLIQKHGFGEDVMSSMNLDQHYLKTSPPDMKDAVKRMKNRFTVPKSSPNKRSRKSSLPSATVSIAPETATTSNGIIDNNYNMNNDQFPLTPQTANPLIDTSSKSMCTQPAHSLLPLPWVSKGGHDPGALRLIDRFLSCDLQPPTMFSPSTSTNYYHPSEHNHLSSTGHTNYYHHPSNQPHPPTGQLTYNYHQPEPHHTTTEPSDYYHALEDDEKPTDLSTYFHHTDEHTSTITTNDYFHQANTSTSSSNQDLIVKTKKVQSDVSNQLTI